MTILKLAAIAPQSINQNHIIFYVFHSLINGKNRLSQKTQARLTKDLQMASIVTEYTSQSVCTVPHLKRFIFSF